MTILIGHTKKHFVIFDHAHFAARAFFDGVKALLEIIDLGRERAIAFLEPGNVIALIGDFVLELVDIADAAAPEPQCILQI